MKFWPPILGRLHNTPTFALGLFYTIINLIYFVKYYLRGNRGVQNLRCKPKIKSLFQKLNLVAREMILIMEALLSRKNPAPVGRCVRFSDRGGILSHPALETRCAAFVGEVGERDGFSVATDSLLGRLIEDERKSRINTRRRQRHRKSHKRPQCGRFSGERFRGQIRL